MIGVVSKRENAIQITLRVTPRASKTELSGGGDQGLKLKVNAPPVEGAANTECIKFLARIFDVPKTAVSLMKGRKSRVKVFEIEGIGLDKATAILKPLLD